MKRQHKASTYAAILSSLAGLGVVAFFLFPCSPRGVAASFFANANIDAAGPAHSGPGAAHKGADSRTVRVDTDRYRRLMELLATLEPREELSDDVQESGQSDIELAQRIIRNQTVAPYVFDLGPTVLDEIIEKQKVNPLWTQSTVDEIRTKLASKKLAGTRIEGARCYDTMCKATFLHDDEAASMTFVRDATKDGNLDGPMLSYVSQRPDGTFERLLYVGRRGEDRNVHGAVYDAMYERITGQSVADIEPTGEQLEKLALQSSGEEGEAVEAERPNKP